MICKTCTNYQNCCKEKLLTVHTWIVIFIELMLSLAYRVSAPDNPVGITYKVHGVCIQVGSHILYFWKWCIYSCAVCQSVNQSFANVVDYVICQFFFWKKIIKSIQLIFLHGILWRKERDNRLFQTIYKRLNKDNSEKGVSFWLEQQLGNAC